MCRELIGELLSLASTVKEYDWASSKSRFLAEVIRPVPEDMLKKPSGSPSVMLYTRAELVPRSWSVHCS